MSSDSGEFAFRIVGRRSPARAAANVMMLRQRNASRKGVRFRMMLRQRNATDLENQALSVGAAISRPLKIIAWSDFSGVCRERFSAGG